VVFCEFWQSTNAVFQMVLTMGQGYLRPMKVIQIAHKGVVAILDHVLMGFEPRADDVRALFSYFNLCCCKQVFLERINIFALWM
jgi:hypothetical protein